MNGKRVIFHTGVGDGVQSMFLLVPEEQLGISVLANDAVSHLGVPCLVNQLLDAYLGIDSIDWVKEAHAARISFDAGIALRRQEMEWNRRPIAPTLPLEAYAGEYIHPAWGTVVVKAMQGKLQVTLWIEQTGELIPWQGDRFELQLAPSLSELPWLIDFQLSPDKGWATGIEFPHLGFFQRHKS